MIDLINLSNKINSSYPFLTKTDNNMYAFKLAERVPIKALDFYWTNEHSSLHSHISRFYPTGFNVDFLNKKKYLSPYNDEYVYINNKKEFTNTKKYSALLSYKTMRLIHKIGFMPYNGTYTGNFTNENHMYTFYSRSKAIGYVDIDYETYITALHAYNSFVDFNDRINNNDYITNDDISLLQVDLSDIQLVFDKNFVDNDTLAYSMLANYLTHIDTYSNSEEASIAVMDSNIKVTYVNSIYEHLTGNTLNNSNNNLFEYE